MENLTVYQKMTSSSAQLIKIVDTEIGVKCCQPFAVRALDALNELNIKTQAEAKKAANIFLDNLQTLSQGGIISEDYDKLDLIKRGNVVTISARVQALLRAFRRKGFAIIDTIIAVPQEDDIYFEENYKENDGIVYLLKDTRKNTDREITAERLVNGYFKRFVCRLQIKNLETNMTIMTVTEMSNAEVMSAQEASENGIFLSQWENVLDEKGNVVINYGRPKKQKVIYNGKNGKKLLINENSIWVKWTSEMVKKTIMRRALKNVKETIPELRKTIMAFDTEYQSIENEEETNENIINVEGVEINVDLKKLTKEQERDVQEIYDIYVENPNQAKKDAEALEAVYKTGKKTQDIINEFYAEIINISKSKKLYPLIKNIVEGVEYEENND